MVAKFVKVRERYSYGLVKLVNPTFFPTNTFSPTGLPTTNDPGFERICATRVCEASSEGLPRNDYKDLVEYLTYVFGEELCNSSSDCTLFECNASANPDNTHFVKLKSYFSGPGAGLTFEEPPDCLLDLPTPPILIPGAFTVTSSSRGDISG